MSSLGSVAITNSNPSGHTALAMSDGSLELARRSFVHSSALSGCFRGARQHSKRSKSNFATQWFGSSRCGAFSIVQVLASVNDCGCTATAGVSALGGDLVLKAGAGVSFSLGITNGVKNMLLLAVLVGVGWLSAVTSSICACGAPSDLLILVGKMPCCIASADSLCQSTENCLGSLSGNGAHAT